MDDGREEPKRRRSAKLNRRKAVGPETWRIKEEAAERDLDNVEEDRKATSTKKVRREGNGRNQARGRTDHRGGDMGPGTKQDEGKE